MAELRGGLYGCGMISEFHLRAWQRIPEVEIVALGNRTVGRAEERRAQFAPRSRTYADLAAMLEKEDLDFVDILTPPALHSEHCLLAKEAGVGVICQKPLCDTLDDARSLVAAMRDHPKLFAVHENHRYRPWFRQILEKFGQGFFGRTHLLRLEHHNQSEPGEIYKLQADEGILLEYGTHLVDMMRALLGEPESVYTRLHNFNPKVKGESLAHVVYEYPQTTAVIDIAWKPAGLLQGSVLLEGDEGEAFYEGTMTRGDQSRFRLLKGDAVVTDERRSPLADYVESFYLIQRECVDAMLSGRGVTQTGTENLKTMESTFAAYASAGRRRIVGVAEFARAHEG